MDALSPFLLFGVVCVCVCVCVLDCWFESGSMPYAQLHYPFENQQYFEHGFPADFIAEGLDQTRGWFYTLMVISTGLFNKPAFKNLIVNGLVLAGDGKKMSKRLKNYPDPNLVVSKYGADALRLYLINSPVVRAEPLRFQEAGVHDVVKSVCLPCFHAYRFFVENVLRYEKENGTLFTAYDSSVVGGVSVSATTSSSSAPLSPKNPAAMNVMDLWILSAFQSLTKFVHQEMAAYRLYTVVPRLLQFIEALTNWYVRMNRSRLKGKYGPEDSHLALSTLFQVLYGLCKLMAPFTPFFVDFMYQNLRRVLPKEQQMDCVHYAMIPLDDPSQQNPAIELSIARMQAVIELGRTARDKAKLTMKRPLKSVLIVHSDASYLSDVQSLAQYVKEELNVRSVDFSSEVDKFILLKATPNRKALGARFGKTSAEAAKFVTDLTHAQVMQLQTAGFVEYKSGEKLTAAEIDVSMQFQGDRSKLMDCGNNDVLVIINIEEDAQLMQESLAREITRRVQQLRKQAGLVPTDDVEFFYEEPSAAAAGAAGAAGAAPVKNGLVAAISGQAKFIRETLGREIYPAAAYRPSHALELVRGSLELEGEQPLVLVVTRMFVSFDTEAIKALQPQVTPAQAAVAQQYLAQKDWAALRAATQHQPTVSMNIDGNKVEFQLNKHFFMQVKDAAEARSK